MSGDPNQAGTDRDAPLAASMTDITTRLRRLADSWEKATGKRENLLTDAAAVIDEQDAEIVRLQDDIERRAREGARMQDGLSALVTAIFEIYRQAQQAMQKESTIVH